jgi:L-lactate dehydrogenase complex protein LldG
MKDRILKRIREANRKVADEPVDLDARLTDRGLDRESLVALFEERAESSGATVHVTDDPKAVMRDLIPPDASTADLTGKVPDDLFGIDVAVTGAELGIAETGTVVLHAGPSQARRISLTAKMHIVLLPADRIVPDLMDWTAAYTDRPLPEGFTLITGPSKTADIELKLVVGVHGPSSLHVIIT